MQYAELSALPHKICGMRIFPAWATSINLSGSRLSMIHSVNPAQTLNVDMQHLPVIFPLVTPRRRLYLQRRKPRVAKFAKGMKDRAPAKSQSSRYHIPAQPFFPQGENFFVYCFRQLAQAAQWTGAFIHERLDTAKLATTFPFSRSCFQKSHCNQIREYPAYTLLACFIQRIQARAR